MIKHLILLIIIVIALAAFEAVALVRLHGQVARYASYWKQYPTAGTFTYVVLGDSAAQGIGASKPQLSYPELLAQQITAKTGERVRIVNLSVSGDKIEDVLTKQVPQLKHYKSDLLTVEIGANDVVHYDASDFQTQYDRLAAALPTGTFVSNVPYFGGRIRRDAETQAASKFISAAATKYGLRLVDLQTETKARQSIFNYAADFFHPNNRGYKNWEVAFWKAIGPTIQKQ